MQEAVAAWRLDVKLEGLQDLALHVQHLRAGELVLTHLEELLEIWRVDLLVLGRDEQRSDAEDVELGLEDLLLAQEAVNAPHCHIQGLRGEAELAMHIDDPLHQERTGSILNFVGDLHILQVVRVDC